MKRATRELERLVRADPPLAVKNPGKAGGPSGGQAAVFFATAHDEGDAATELQDGEEPF